MLIYKIKEKIGQGGEGQVKVATRRGDSDKEYVVKEIRVEFEQEDHDEVETARKSKLQSSEDILDKLETSNDNCLGEFDEYNMLR